MSDNTPTTPLPPGIEPQDDEHIDYSAVLKVAFGALAFFAVGIIYALWLLDRDTGAINQRENAPPAALAGCELDPNRCAQVGIVEQRPFELEQRAIDMKKAATNRLTTWGWIDQPNQVVHIPIDDAMKKVLAGERAGSPATPAPEQPAPAPAPQGDQKPGTP